MSAPPWYRWPLAAPAKPCPPSRGDAAIAIRPTSPGSGMVTAHQPRHGARQRSHLDRPRPWAANAGALLYHASHEGARLHGVLPKHCSKQSCRRIADTVREALTGAKRHWLDIPSLFSPVAHPFFVKWGLPMSWIAPPSGLGSALARQQKASFFLERGFPTCLL